MANDMFGGLGGLMKGLSGLMPQDDPKVQLMNAQNEVQDLKNQETEVYTEIGKLVFQQHPDAFPAQANKLQLIQANLAEAEGKLTAQTQANQAAEQAAQEATASLTCPGCGHRNPAGTKFCQECGAKLGTEKLICPSCGMENSAGTKFCGGCGARLGE